MQNTKNPTFTSLAMATAVVCAIALTACGGGTSNEVEATPTPTPVATPTPTPAATPTPSPTPAVRVSKAPNIYYYDENGQWRLMPGVTPAQAMQAGVLCKIPTDDGTRNAYLAAGRTLEWIAANIYSLDLCSGY